MSQIQQHLLDPENVSVMTEANTKTVKRDIVLKLNKLALAMVYNLGSESDTEWGEVILKNNILDMFTYTNAKTLKEDDLRCLVGRLFRELDSSIPCNTSGIHF